MKEDWVRIKTKAEMERDYGPQWRTNAIVLRNNEYKYEETPFYFAEICDELLVSEVKTDRFNFKNKNYFEFKWRGMRVLITSNILVWDHKGPDYYLPDRDKLNHFAKVESVKRDFMSDWSEGCWYSELDKDELCYPKTYDFNIKKLLEED